MKKLQLYQLALFIFLSLSLTGCDIVGGIFEAGVWVGVIAVILVIVLIIWLIKKIIS
ncbi:hypothetical protein [Marivirga lumbricoides]|uniref:hypothetical protein n=1 Tax=Marivirga lumbricoides TaxID=1046115 RepID=UPI001666EB5B